mgnify:FL=1
MTCRNDKAMMKHSRLCEINYPYTRFAESNNVMASHVRDCTRDQHFCVDCGRKTVDGRRLSWLWVYPDGNVRPAHKKGDKPNLI